MGRIKSGLGSRWLIAAPALLVSLFSFVPSAEADGFGGWVSSQSCPTSGSVEVAGSSVVLHGADYGGCSGQPHWVKIEATIPADVDTVDFDWGYQTNDGAWYDPPQYAVNGNYVMLTMLNNASGSESVPVVEGDVFTFRQYSTDTCCAPGHLTISNLSLWVQSSTTTTSSTVLEAPTTTMPESTTSTLSPSTTMGEPQTTSTVLENISSTTSSSSTTTPSSLPTAPATNTTSTTSTLLPLQTTTTSTSTSSSTVPVTLYIPSTTTEPSTTTTEPIPEPPSTTTTTVAEVTTTTEYVTTTSEQPIPTTIPENPTTSVLSLPDEVEPPLSDEELVTVLDALETADEAEVQALVDEVLEKDLDTSQAASLVSSPAVLASVTSEQAVALFEEISPEQLTPAEAEAVVEAVQEAPTSVRKAFEAVLNLFQGFADNYVMTGQQVPIKTRRALIALTAVFLTVAPAPSRRIK